MAKSKAELIKTSLRANVTESAANTYTEQSISTNLAVRGDHLFIITGMWYDISGGMTADGDQVRFQVTYSPQTDLIRPDDPDYLFGVGFRAALTTSGGFVWQRNGHMPIDHFPIAVPTLYLGVESASLGAASQIGVKIEGYHMKVATSEYFRIAQSR